MGDLTCGNLEISLVVIWLEVTGLKKTWFMCLLDLFGEKGWYALSVCGAQWTFEMVGEKHRRPSFDIF